MGTAAAIPVMTIMQYSLGQMEATRREREARKAEERALARWEETAYPKPEAVTAARKSGQTALTLAREKAGERIPAQLAARGFGPESGLMPEAYEEVEKGYAQALGEFESDITRWAETPGMEMPSAAFPTGEYYGGGTESLSTAMGMMSAMSMYGSMYGGGGGYNPYLSYQSTSGSGGQPSFPEYQSFPEYPGY